MDFNTELIKLLIKKVKQGEDFSLDLVDVCYFDTAKKFPSDESVETSKVWISFMFNEFKKVECSVPTLWDDEPSEILEKLYHPIAKR